MSENFLELQNITFSYQKKKQYIFENFSVSIPSSNNIIGLLGSNGSGKTALAKILIGLVKTESGKVYLNEEDITKLRTTKRLSKISMTFQMTNNSFVKNTVKDELNYTYKLAQKIRSKLIQNDQRSNILPENWSSKTNQQPLTLSGGEKRKLIFQLLRILNPDLYILDEPTVGLDFYNIQELKKEIEQLKQSNKKVIIISHDLPFLLSLIDTCIILDKNENSNLSSLLYQGSLENYLLEQFSEADQFLNIPIEFIIYREKLLKNDLNKNFSYKNFLSS